MSLFSTFVKSSKSFQNQSHVNILRRCNFSEDFLSKKNILNSRTFSSARGASVPQAAFHWETLMEGKHIEILRNKNPNVNLTQATLNTPSVPSKIMDETNKVVFDKVPRGFIENKKEAQKRNVVSMYSSSRKIEVLQGGYYVLPSAASEITIDFHPKTFTGELTDEEEVKKYIDEKKAKFFESMGLWGFFSKVKMSPVATSQFTEKGIPFSIGRFFGELDPAQSPSIGILNGYYSLILKTQGGFWEVCWYSSEADLEEHRNYFYDIVKHIRVKNVSDQSTTTASTATSSTSNNILDNYANNGGDLNSELAEAIKAITKSLTKSLMSGKK